MKKMESKTTKYFLVLIPLLLIFVISACTRKISFENSTVVPAARGSVKVKRDNNRNYHIQIFLSSLAESSRLQPARNTYVVWMIGDNNNAKNIGQIKSSVTFISKKLKASFESVSATKPSKIFITAEDDPGVEFPGSEIVLSTSDF